MLKLIEAWLERTPGLVMHSDSENGDKIEINYFKEEYQKSVNKFLEDTYLNPAEVDFKN